MTTLQGPTSTPELLDGPNALRLSGERFRCTVATSAAEVEPFAEAWDALAREAGCGIQHTWPWIRTWHAIYGLGRPLRILALHAGDELVGVVPLVLDHVRLGPVAVRVAKLAGTDHTQVLGDLPCRTAWIDTAVAAATARAFGPDECDALSLGPLTSETPRTADIAAAARRTTAEASFLRERTLGKHMTFVLPDRFDAWMKGLSKNARKSIRKGMTRLRNDYEVEVEVLECPTDDPTAIDGFIDMHQAQWSHAGMLGHFRDWPSAPDFHRRLADALSLRGSFHLMRLRADGSVVAQHLSHLHGDRCHWLLTGRAMGDAWHPYALGKTSFLPLVEDMIERGVRTIDACVGRYDYKERLGAEAHEVRSVLLVSNRRGARRRVQAFIRIADAIDKVYYRGWYGRVAPRLATSSLPSLPLLRRGLRSSWIRSRI